MNYGRGRARNILKHRAWPRLRQLLPLAVAPVVVGSSLAFLSWAAFVPAGTWMLACVGYGVWMAVGKRNPYGPLAAVSAMIMHLAWSAGFWLQLLDFRRREVARMTMPRSPTSRTSASTWPSARSAPAA